MTSRGALDQLAAAVGELAIPCQRQHKGCFVLRVFDDGVHHRKRNWWPDSGALRFGGDPEQPQNLMSRAAQLLTP